MEKKQLRINDRPFAKDRSSTSQKYAEKIGVIKHGTMNVKLVLLENGTNKYHRYHTNSYEIRIASFSNYENGQKMVENLKQKKIDAILKEITLDKVFYRVILENLNYSEVELYRVKLHGAGVDNYKVVKF